MSLPEGWVVNMAQDYCVKVADGTHDSPKQSDKGKLLVTSKNIKNGVLDLSNAYFISEEDFFDINKRSKVDKWDILLSMIGTVGEVCLINKEPDFAIKNVGLFKCENEIKSKWLYYFLKSYDAKAYLVSRLSGTTQKYITLGSLREYPILYPKSTTEQKAIANILSSFDEKIELLKAQNETLEQMAQGVFREWFTKYNIGDKLPDGWRIGNIGELVEIKRGGSPRPIKDYISDSGYRWLKISDATATHSPFIFNIKEHIKVEGLNKTTLKKAGDLVLSNSATPGLPKFLAVDTCVHDGWMHFPSSKVSSEYLYLLFKYIRPQLLQQGSGSVFVNLKTDILRYFEIIIANDKIYNDFDEIIKPIFNKIYNNAFQIQTLQKTRDTLLPKLMSGERRVKGF